MTSFQAHPTLRSRALLGGALLVGLVACATGCASQGPVVKREYGSLPPLSSAEFGGMRNVSVSDGIWLGSIPSLADLDLAHRRGIDLAVDLALPAEKGDDDLSTACAALSIHYVPLGIEDDANIPDATVDRVLELLRERERRPVLLFCGNGSRSALFFAIHRAADEGMPLEDALIEARRAGMMPGASEEFVRAQVARLGTHATERQPLIIASATIASAMRSH